MFNFMKNMCPTVYTNFRQGTRPGSKIKEDLIVEEEPEVRVKTRLNGPVGFIMRISKTFLNKKAGERGVFAKQFSALSYGKSDEKLIEVFDVVIQTPTRLVIVDPVTKQDILHMPQYTDNIHQHLKSTFQINSHELDEDDESPVYDLHELDRRQYDTQDEAYR